MAGYYDDPDQWRLQTNGGIHYKLLGMDGSFEKENATVNWRVLVHTNDFLGFVTEFFPPSIQVGNLSIPLSYPLPGLPGVIAKRVSFKSQDDNKPIDPFGFDSDAGNNTYHPLIELNIEFGPRENSEPDETDPTTFLEISGNATGEFIHAPTSASEWQPKTGDEEIDEDTGEPTGGSSEPAEDEDGELEEVAEGDGTAENPEVGESEPNRNPNVPATIIVPETEWTVKWTQMDHDFFHSVMIHRLRALMGKVNNRRVPVLFNASKETLLFVGYTYQSQYTWREGKTRTPPVQVEMKFVEKRIVDRGVVRGHNDFWRPGVGWETLLVDGNRKAYESIDHNLMFKV